MSADPSAAMRICPECKAENPPNRTGCWLCHKHLPAQAQKAASASAAPVVKRFRAWPLVLLWALLGVLVLGCLWLDSESYAGFGILTGGAIMFAIVMVLDQPASAGGRFLIVLGMILSLGVAAVVAFAIVCGKALNRPWH